MALFFDQEWFDARLRERGMDKQTLAVILGISRQEIDAIWKDQREISEREVVLLAELLGVATKEIAERGGAATPAPAIHKGGKGGNDLAQVLERLNVMNERIANLERGMAQLTALLAAQKPQE